MRFLTTLVALIFSASLAHSGEMECRSLAAKTPKNLAGFKQARIEHKEKPRWGKVSKVYYKRTNRGTLHVAYFDLGNEGIHVEKSLSPFGIRLVWMKRETYGHVDVKKITTKPSFIMDEIRTRPDGQIQTNGPAEYMSYGIKNSCFLEVRLVSKEFDQDLEPLFKKIQSELIREFGN